MAGWGEPSTSQLPPSGPLGSCLLSRGEGQRGWSEKGFFPRLGVRGPLPGLGPLVAGHCYFCTPPGPWIQLLPRRVPGAAIQLGWCGGKRAWPSFLNVLPWFPLFLSFHVPQPGLIKMASPSRVGEIWMGQEGEVVRDNLFSTSLISLGLATFPRWLPPNPLITPELPGFSYSRTTYKLKIPLCAGWRSRGGFGGQIYICMSRGKIWIIGPLIGIATAGSLLASVELLGIEVPDAYWNWELN